MHTKFWSENKKERDHSEDLGGDGKITSEWILVQQREKVWAECVWFRRGTTGKHLGAR